MTALNLTALDIFTEAHTVLLWQTISEIHTSDYKLNEISHVALVTTNFCCFCCCYMHTVYLPSFPIPLLSFHSTIFPHMKTCTQTYTSRYKHACKHIHVRHTLRANILYAHGLEICFNHIASKC